MIITMTAGQRELIGKRKQTLDSAIAAIESAKGLAMAAQEALNDVLLSHAHDAGMTGNFNRYEIRRAADGNCELELFEEKAHQVNGRDQSLESFTAEGVKQ